MINVSISPDGEIVISQETPGERIYMGEHYARMERESQPTQETLNDDERAAMFKQGWESAIRESQIQYVAGRIEDFWNEMGVAAPVSEDPHHNEPEGTGEAPDQPLIRPAVDSGEPDLEAEPVPDVEEGTWTISNEELQSRLDAEFERGLNYSSPTVPPRYTAAQLSELRAESYGQGVADAGKSTPASVSYSAVRGAFDRAVAEADERMEEWRNQEPDMSKHISPDHTSLVLHGIFRNLGIEVQP